MFLEILAITIFLGAALVLYIDYVTESTLKSKLKSELPETLYADVENITYQYDKTYGTTYHLKARKRDGTSKNVEVKCKNGSVSKKTRIHI